MGAPFSCVSCTIVSLITTLPGVIECVGSISTHLLSDRLESV
jgi:hypothetical protein